MVRRWAAFTLIELIVVIGIIAVLAAIVIIAINPSRQFALSRNTQRRSDVRALASALSQQASDQNGGAPYSGLTITPQEIGTGAGNLDLTSLLVPTYLAAIPKDPSTGTNADTQYRAYIDTQSRIIVDSVASELGVQISSNGSFSPSQIAGLRLWFAADSLGLSNGAAVSTWGDQSSSSNNATQTTGTNQPTYQTNAVNKRPVVHFNGTTSYLSLTKADKIAEYYTVFRSPVTPFQSYGGVLEHSDGYGVTPRMGPFQATGTTFHSNPYPMAVRKNGTDLSIPFDLSSITSFMVMTVDTYSPTSIRNMEIGALDGPYYFNNLDIAEIIGFDHVLSPSERGQVEQYLGTKYGIVVH